MTAGSGLAAVVLFVVALVSSVSMGLAFLALVIAAIAGFMLRSTLRP